MTDESEAPKKARRQPRNPGEGRRPAVTFRCRGVLQDKLKAAAETADRSFSEEIERRLDASFEQEETLNRAVSAATSYTIDRIFSSMATDLGGKQNFNAGLRFANVLKNQQKAADEKFRSEKPWYQDFDKKKYVTDHTKELVSTIIDILIEDLDPEASERARQQAQNSALGRLAADWSPFGGLGSLFEPAPPASPAAKPDE